MPRKKKPLPARKKPRLTDRERGRIEGLHEAGLSARDIALVTARSRDTVARVVSPAPQKPPKRPCPPPTLTDRETRRLVRTASKGNLSAAKLKAELQLSVPVRTIQRNLSRVDWLVYTKMVNALPLKPEDMEARKKWASAMLVRKDAGAVWDTIIFSDEKKWTWTARTAFSTTGETYENRPAKRSDGKLGAAPSWSGLHLALAVCQAGLFPGG